MAGSVTSLGIGAGIDLESLLANIIAAEQRPLVLLEGRKIDAETKISALGQIRSSLSEFQTAVEALSTPESFRTVTATSSDDSVFTASASDATVAGAYDIVVTQLAQRNRLGSQIIADKTAALGTGSIEITVGADAFTLTIDSSNNSLEQIRDAINDDVNNTGVAASIINVDGGAKLILTASDPGTANQIVVTVTDDDTNNTDNAGLSQVIFGQTEIDAALDATLTVDGAAVTRASNEITDVIDGVTLSLVGTGSGTVSLSENKTAAGAQISTLISSYNTLVATINAERGTSLSGEALLLTLETRLRSIFSAPYGSSSAEITRLLDVGVSFNEDGIASFDQTKFDELAVTNFDELQSLFTDTDNGFIGQLDGLIDSYLQTEGLIEARTDGLNSTIESIDDDIETTELRIARTEERLRAQFVSLDVLTNQLSATSTFLTTQLANLPVFTRDNN